MAEDLHRQQRGDAALQPLALAHGLPVLGDLEQEVEVHSRVVRALLESRHDHLDGRLAVAEGERDDGRVDDVRAGLGGLEVVHRSHATDVVAVDVHRQPDLFLERLDHALGAERGEHAGHVLDADGVGADVLELAGVVDERVERVHGAHGVGDGALEVTAALLDRASRHLDVADVVQGVEHPEDVDAVALRCAHEALHDLVGVVVVAHEVLAAQQHLKRRVLDVLLDRAETLPRVLVEEPQCGVERRAAPHFQRPVPHRVHLREDGEHVADLHAGRPQRLVGVAQRRIGDPDGFHDSLLANTAPGCGPGKSPSTPPSGRKHSIYEASARWCANARGKNACLTSRQTRVT